MLDPWFGAPCSSISNANGSTQSDSPQPGPHHSAVWGSCASPVDAHGNYWAKPGTPPLRAASWPPGSFSQFKDGRRNRTTAVDQHPGPIPSTVVGGVKDAQYCGTSSLSKLSWWTELTWTHSYPYPPTSPPPSKPPPPTLLLHNVQHEKTRHLFLIKN